LNGIPPRGPRVSLKSTKLPGLAASMGELRVAFMGPTSRADVSWRIGV
jgi:hypothetical protein